MKKKILKPWKRIETSDDNKERLFAKKKTQILKIVPIYSQDEMFAS